MKIIGAVALLALVSACATYLTPGSGLSLKAPSSPDQDIDSLSNAKPSATFPARIAMARIQMPGYHTKGGTCHGSGKYCVVTTQEVETEKDIERIARLPMVAELDPVGRVSLPESFQSYRDLRLVAASLKADMLLLYSVDTTFRVEAKTFGPSDMIPLGLLPKKDTRVTTTASSVLMDVQTGFVYGRAESTASEENTASAWTTTEAIDAARLRTESAAFQRLVSELEKLWTNVVNEHAGKQVEK